MQQSDAARRGLVLIVLAATLWGTLGVATRALYAVAEIRAIEISFVRLAIATPVLLLCCRIALGTPAIRVRRADAGLMAFSGVMMAVSQVGFAASVGETGVSVATLVTLCIAPVVVAVCSVWLLGERPDGRVALALLSALAGTALLVVGQADERGAVAATPAGVLLALGAALSYALSTLSQRSLLGRYHPLLVVTVGSAGGAALLALPLLLSRPSFAYPPLGWALLLYLGLFTTVLAYLLFLYGMRHTSATIATIITLQEAVVAGILAWLLFGEQLGPLGLLGAALLLGAIGLLYRKG